MILQRLKDVIWPSNKAVAEYEEAENENLLRDHDVAMMRNERSNDQIAQAQSKLLESIRLANPDEMRETINTLLERNRWRA